MIEVRHDDQILAIIIPGDSSTDGVEFFTPDSFSQQLAAMSHPRGKKISPHIHNQVDRVITLTQEVLLIRKGKLRVDFYSNEKEFLSDYTLEAGDVILLASGGHGFEVLEDIEMIEVKQGPFVGDHDKTRFDPVG